MFDILLFSTRQNIFIASLNATDGAGIGARVIELRRGRSESTLMKLISFCGVIPTGYALIDILIILRISGKRQEYRGGISGILLITREPTPFRPLVQRHS